MGESYSYPFPKDENGEAQWDWCASGQMSGEEFTRDFEFCTWSLFCFRWFWQTVYDSSSLKLNFFFMSWHFSKSGYTGC